MNYSKPFYKIVIEGDNLSFVAYNETSKEVILMQVNDENGFNNLIDFIYETVNGQTSVRKELN